jgi:hypothetical protein
MHLPGRVFFVCTYLFNSDTIIIQLLLGMNKTVIYYDVVIMFIVRTNTKKGK